MRHLHHLLLRRLTVSLALTIMLCTPSHAEDTTLMSIGPRVGFSGKSPLLGKEQKHSFLLIDLAAVFKLPWSWPVGSSSWNLETRLITSAGLLTAAHDSGLMVTVVPDLALTGWNGLVGIDVGGGAGFLTHYKFGEQNIGGPVQIVATAGIRINPIPHTYAGFRVQHMSDAGLYGNSTLGVDMYILEVGYRF